MGTSSPCRRRREAIRYSASLLAVAIVVSACAGAASPSPTEEGSPSPVSEEPSPSPSVAPSAGPGEESPYDGAVPGSGVGRKIGYISLGESIPFVKLVSDSIKEQGRIAGAEIVFCDSQIDAAKALECARNLKVQGVEGVLNFQAFADSAPEICAAYGGLPTIAIDIEQKPCQVVFMGANNRRAGEIAGLAVGEALKAENGCQYNAALTLESPQVGEVNEARTGGMIAGFESVCGTIPLDKLRRLGVGGTTDAAVTQVSDAMSAIPSGGVIVVLSLNDDMALGALAAARTAGRQGELRIGAQGADPSAWKEIACNPSWVADAAYFPERYGRILVPAMIDILDGKTVPEFLYTPHQAITRDNVRVTYPDTPAC